MLLLKNQKPVGRRLTLFLIGMFLIGFAISMGRENVQIEGAIFGLLTGMVQMAVMHYLSARVFVPVLFGWMWCGWACWTIMVLDLLPFKRPSGRPGGLAQVPPVGCGSWVTCTAVENRV